jgi:DNA-binding LytR/AlgR family response regulator
MDKYLMIKTRDETLRINLRHIYYFEADRNYTKLLLIQGVQFTFAVNLGKIEELLLTQLLDPTAHLIRVGKSHIVNRDYILQINIPKQKMLLLADEGKPREIIVPKEPLKALKDALEMEVHEAINMRKSIKDEEK